MFSNAHQRIGLMAGALVLAGAAALAFSSRSSDVEIKPGTEVLSTQEEGIRAITYRTAEMTLAARRGSAGPFTVKIAYSDGRALEQCQASEDLGGLLPAFAKIEAKRQLTPQQVHDEFPVEAGTVEVEDQVDEPISPFNVRLTRDRSALALVYDHTAVEADLAPVTFARLEAVCKESEIREEGELRPPGIP